MARQPGAATMGAAGVVDEGPTGPRPVGDAWSTGPSTGACLIPIRGGRSTPGWFAPAPASRRPELCSPEQAAAVLLPSFAGADRERCVAALLDTKHRLLAIALVSVGSIDHTFMAPREVFRDALLANASAVVVAHNHPSGDPEPSADDERITRRLARAGELVGVTLLDHLVVGGDRWVSLARRGCC
ncbi:MAG: JAB domain-containing protein [Nitriliruptoraceae bacterium]|nr:JAB domain-containing protein [Nitriliruptoraceae bacterium]